MAPSCQTAKKWLDYHMVWTCHVCELGSDIYWHYISSPRALPRKNSSEKLAGLKGGKMNWAPVLWMCSLGLGVCLGQWCLAAINHEGGWCCEANRSSACDEREHPLFLSLGRCLVGVREATMQFAGPGKGFSNRKRGKRRGVDCFCTTWNINCFDSISLTGSLQVKIRYDKKYIHRKVIFKCYVCCIDYILLLSTDSI